VQGNNEATKASCLAGRCEIYTTLVQTCWCNTEWT